MNSKCYLCQKPLKKTGTVSCTECSGKYHSLSMKGILLISREQHIDMKRSFGWDEVSVLL